MKKGRLSLILFVLLLIGMLVSFAGNAEAASLKMKKLKKGKKYSIDLNGGKKEKVKYTLTKLSNDRQRFNLYVNGKRVYKYTVADYGVVSGVRIVDMNTKDNYKEIIVGLAGEFSDWWVMILRYEKSGKITAFKKFSNYKGTMSPAKTGRVDFRYYKNTGKNKLYLTNETPFSNPNFGCYYILAPIELKNGKMCYLRDKTYKLVGLEQYAPGLFGGNYYKLKAHMTLYKDASQKTPIKELYYGDTFVPQRIKPLADAYGNPLYVKVKTADGTTGWLYFPAERPYGFTGYLTALPAWG